MRALLDRAASSRASRSRCCGRSATTPTSVALAELVNELAPGRVRQPLLRDRAAPGRVRAHGRGGDQLVCWPGVGRRISTASSTGCATAGFDGRLLVMQCNGGVADVEHARTSPIRLLGSGPAGGISGVAVLAARAGHRNVIATDMGGTSFEVGLLIDGRAVVSGQQIIDQYTFHQPHLDARSIACGGGSIASISPDGGLRVGPHSAGSSPGPACYGRGGTEPTVTDADVVLGLLEPGRVPRRRDAARRRRCARRRWPDRRAARAECRGGGGGHPARQQPRCRDADPPADARAGTRPAGLRRLRVRRRGPAARVGVRGRARRQSRS